MQWFFQAEQEACYKGGCGESASSGEYFGGGVNSGFGERTGPV